MERSADGRIRTTEWEDIQYKHGNKVGKYVTHEVELLAQRVRDANPDIHLKSYDANEEKVRDKLERGGYDADAALKDPEDVASDDDDDALASFRRRRLAEMQAAAAKNVFGVVRHISGTDYVKEITDGSQSHWVIGIMVAPGNEDCDALVHVAQQVASRRRDMKFVSLLAAEAVAKMPAKMLPCVVLYHQGKLVTQYTQLEPWLPSGERHVTVESFERVLGRAGALKLDDEEEGEYDERDEDFSRRLAMRNGDALRRY